MNLNRTTRIGLFFLAVAVIFAALWGLSRMVFSSFNSTNTTIAETPKDATPTAQPVAQVVSSTVYVARADIPERSILTADMFAPTQLTGDTAGYVTNLQDQAVGYITRNPIPKGNRLRPSYLVGHITQVGVAGAVRPGMVAQIVPIPSKTTLHDLVKVGDYVDIIGSFDNQESRTIVQNVRVLAVDVFGKDFPQVKVAQRGDFKADPSGISEANPPSPAPAAPAAPGAPAPASGQPEQPTPAPTATPTPAPAGPVAKPEAALTLEVSRQQAVALALAQSSNSPLDFVLRPHELGLFAGNAPATGSDGQISEPEVRSASILRSQLAPGAERLKRSRADAARSSLGGGLSGGNLGGGRGPVFPTPLPQGKGGQVEPMPFSTLAPVAPPRALPTSPPPTYDIPVYGDGKLVRTDTVRNPAASATPQSATAQAR